MKMSRRRYKSWGNFLKKHREQEYRSAREFCAKVSLGISYPQYSRYESGDQLPSLEQALMLCKTFKVPLIEGLLEWGTSQVQDMPMKSELENALALLRSENQPVAPNARPRRQESLPAPRLALDDLIVINRSHLPVFEADPFYRDIFSYLTSYQLRSISSEDLARSLGLPQVKVAAALKTLVELGFAIEESTDRYRAVKRNFYFPDDEDFFRLRNINFMHNVDSIMGQLTYEGLQSRKAYRALVTRELLPDQLDIFIRRMAEVMAELIEFPKTPDQENTYSVCALIGQRFSRQQQTRGESL